MNVLRICSGMLVAALVAACGGGDTTGAGGATTTSTTGAGGGVGKECETCVEVKVAFDTAGTPCHDASEACQADAACAAWMQCTNTCFREHRAADCFNACDAASPSAKNLYDPLYACVCKTCSSECKATCM